MAKKVTSNYTDEMTAELVEAYTACGVSDSEADQKERANVVGEFAEKFDLHPASIRGKLVRTGDYIAKVNLTKQGTAVESKDSIVEQIADFLDVSSEVADSLSKANKGILQAVRDALTPVVEPVGDTPDGEGDTPETA